MSYVVILMSFQTIYSINPTKHKTWASIWNENEGIGRNCMTWPSPVPRYEIRLVSFGQ
jgi:hypothetical protein